MSTNGENFEQNAQNGIKIATVNSAKTPVRSTVVRSPGNKENQANQDVQQEMVSTPFSTGFNPPNSIITSW